MKKQPNSTEQQCNKQSVNISALKRQFLLNILEIDKELTNWHLNDRFIDYGKEFFDGSVSTLGEVRRSFNYECNKLVKEGILKPAKRYGIGHCGVFDFGTRTQTIWRPV